MNTEKRYLDLIGTFWINTASVKFRPILKAMIQAEEDAKPKPIKTKPLTYEERAAAYYAKHGTVGEF